ncbi:SPOR domain-containing protein [Geminicoccaceae bacterium 1502E]|nr:SPOR domain-containing protein [Geminicoccaceae bacterium 1502E]
MSSADPHDSQHDPAQRDPGTPRSRIVAEDPPRQRASRRVYLGTAFAVVFALFAWIVWWAYEETLGGGGEPPLVRASDAPYKRSADTPGGLDTETEGVSSVFGERRETVRIERLLPRQEAAPPRPAAELLPPPEPEPDPLEAPASPAAVPPLEGPADLAPVTAAVPPPAAEEPAAPHQEPEPEPAPVTTAAAPPAQAPVPTPAPAPRPAQRPQATAAPAEPAGGPRPLAATRPDAGPAARADGLWLIQIAALSSRAAVESAWERLRGKHGQLLGGLSLRVDEVPSGSGRLFRMQAAAFSDRSEAARVCAGLKAAGTDCFVVARR